MSVFKKKSFTVLVAAALLLMWAVSPALAAEQTWTKEEPGGLEMGFDLLVLRPLGLVATVGGTALFIISLPFSLLGGNSGKAGKVLVAEPFAYTFARPLGHESR